MTSDKYLAEFLEWERTHPDAPFGDWPGLVRAIRTTLSDGQQMRAVLGVALQDTERLDWMAARGMRWLGGDVLTRAQIDAMRTLHP